MCISYKPDDSVTSSTNYCSVCACVLHYQISGGKCRHEEKVCEAGWCELRVCDADVGEAGVHGYLIMRYSHRKKLLTPVYTPRTFVQYNTHSGKHSAVNKMKTMY